MAVISPPHLAPLVVRSKAAETGGDSFRVHRNLAALTPAAPLVLAKLAKHLALLVCVIIIGASGGRLAIGQVGLFLLVVFAALVHSVARTLQRRSALRLSRETS